MRWPAAAVGWSWRAAPLLPERTIGPLTRPARYCAPISLCRQLSTCLLHPAEQVGEQYGGVAGWRASLGSDGTAGGTTAGE